MPTTFTHHRPSSGQSTNDGNPVATIIITVVLAVVLSGLVFSGLLTFRHSDYDDLMTRGQQLLAEGKVARAAQVFETVLKQYGESYPIYLNLGKAYLALDQPNDAQMVLEAALKLKPPSGSVDALLAKSQLLVVNQQYTDAIEILQAHLDTLPKNHPGRNPLRTSLADVYTYWADNARRKDDLTEALTHYQAALPFVGSYAQEQVIQTDMANAALLLSENYLKAKDNAGMIAVLEPIMAWSTDPTLMIRLADAYQQEDQLDKAIYWYRQAYDAEPESIRSKLSQVLLARGRQLAAQKDTNAAQPYFNEAEALVANVGDDMAKAMLYPVKVTGFSITPHFNRGKKTLAPTVSYTLVSEAHRPIDVLSARLQYRVGPNVLARSVRLVANLDEPLGELGSKTARRKLTMGLSKPINIAELGGQTVTVELALAYANGEAFQGVTWQTKALQDITIRGEEVDTETADGDTTEPGQQPFSFLDTPTANE